MISMKRLVDMIATEAAEGPPTDECGNPMRPPEQLVGRSDLPPISYKLRLVRQPDGELDWVE